MKVEINLKQLLEKYEQGSCSAKEKEMLHSYFDSFQDANDIWDEIGIEKKETIRNEVLYNIDLKLQKNRPNKNLWLKIAASIILIIGLGLTFSYINTNTNKTREISVVTKTATYGQKMTLKLPDGSQVRLNSGSSLSYPEVFSDIRSVTLVGEAYFEVTKDPNKKFIVSTEDITTTVLGTSFNISAYPDEELKVTVETGKVAVSSNNERLELLSGQQATYESINNSLSMSTVDIGKYTSWRKGILQFNGNTLPEIATELERWYGVEIEFDTDQANHCNLRLTFDNQSLEHVLGQLETVTGVNTHLNNGIVKITGLGCRS
ncbi:FecR domain-containing protein [Reichenbachiella sp. MALMAid0571]|uniref:FecR family protein n=1 Tax=Reichenbachiella sp. MALMAid0571 TaxID=3143939 RepID=UPI0032DE8341